MKDYPVIKIAIAVIAGILFSKIFVIPFFIALISSAITIILYFLYLRSESSQLLQMFSEFSVLLLFVILANIYTAVSSHDTPEIPDELHREKEVTVYGSISDIDLIKEFEVKFEILTDSIIVKNKKYNSEGIILYGRIRDSVNVLKDFYNNIYPGYKLSFKGTLSRGREQRNPGEFDYNKYLLAEGISGLITTYSTENIGILSQKKLFFASVIFSVRKFLDGQLKNLHNGETSSLLRGLILADRSGIDNETKTSFINSGVIHVLAVSGLHVGYVVMIFIILFGRFNLYIKTLLTITGLLIFLLITGMPASVTRAVIMAIVIFIAFLTNRSTNIFNSLSIAALIILIINPSDIFKAGFQLSFSAVASIGAVYPKLEKMISSKILQNKILRYLSLFLAVSFSAQIGTLPFTLYYFGKLSLIALVMNLIVIPAIGLVVGLAFVTIAFSFISHFIASCYAAVNDLVVFLLMQIIRFSGALPFSFLNINSYSLIDSVIFYTVFAVLIYLIGRFTSLYGKLILILLSVAIIIVYSSLDDSELLPENKLSVMAVDVGQGDAILIKYPDGKTALVDAGDATAYYDSGELTILPLLNYLEIDKIDIAYISHMHRDHYGGFVSLIHHNRIKEIVKPRVDSNSVSDLKFEQYLRQKAIPFSYYSKSLLSECNTRIYYLNNEFILSNKYFGSNNSGGVIKITYGSTNVLLTGDIEKKAERYYSDLYGNFLDSDLLKVAHHGSNTSSTEEFLSFVTPGFAVISAGFKNKFDHPSAEVIERFEKYETKVFRTDKSGAVLFISDGNKFMNINWRN
ncbi:MAG: DNA internalization-related competence protein ComEC/Rec2 [Ignavibacteriaceae bacterium]